MAIQRIPCGGFFYDDSQIKFVDNMIQIKGGGGSGGVTIFDAINVGDDGYAVQCSAKELWDAYQTRPVLIKAVAQSGGAEQTSYMQIKRAVLDTASGAHKYTFDLDGISFGADNDSDSPDTAHKP